MIRVSSLSLCIIILGILGFFSIKYSYQKAEKSHNSNYIEFVEYNNTRFYCDGDKVYFLQGIRDFYVINSEPVNIITYRRSYVNVDLCKDNK